MSFDRLARHYRWMEFFLAGSKLQQCRTAFLDRVTAARNVLIAGEGNGRFLIEFRRCVPAAQITVVDSSAEMLRAARARLLASGANTDGVAFVHSSILAYEPREQAHDLIVTQFFLDCFPADQLERVVAILARSATTRAMWLVADFQIPAHGLRRERALVIHALMYAFFRLAAELPARRLVPPGPFLASHGFVLQERKTSDWDLLHSDLWTRDWHVANQ